MPLLMIAGLISIGMGFPYLDWEARLAHTKSDKPAVTCCKVKVLSFCSANEKRIIDCATTCTVTTKLYLSTRVYDSYQVSGWAN